MWVYLWKSVGMKKGKREGEGGGGGVGEGWYLWTIGICGVQE